MQKNDEREQGLRGNRRGRAGGAVLWNNES